jgi:hypothetical protein
MQQLALHVEAREADRHRAAELAWDLKRELAERSRAESVEHAPATAPAGAKGAAFEWTQLLVTFSGGLPGLVALIRGWADRHQDAGVAVSLELDGDKITLADATPEERQRLLELFAARHG